jgi:hypothetical protein
LEALASLFMQKDANVLIRQEAVFPRVDLTAAEKGEISATERSQNLVP